MHICESFSLEDIESMQANTKNNSNLALLDLFLWTAPVMQWLGLDLNVPSVDHGTVKTDRSEPH